LLWLLLQLSKELLKLGLSEAAAERRLHQADLSLSLFELCIVRNRDVYRFLSLTVSEILRRFTNKWSLREFRCYTLAPGPRL
jgi:hypothetical protein